MNLTPLFFALLAFATGTAQAGQHFACGDALVTIDIVAHKSTAWEDRAVARVIVTKAGDSTVLRYPQIDFIGGQCVERPNAAALLVFQAYCGGSGCADNNNWGVIDTASLRVLTVPRDDNRDETRKLLGDAPLPKLTMISVQAEAKAMGIQVP